MADGSPGFVPDIAAPPGLSWCICTWAGTVSAARALRDTEPPTSPADAKRKIAVCVKAVAGLLGNTPTVCRSSYVHPRVFAMFEAGELAALPGPDTAGFEKALPRTLAT